MKRKYRWIIFIICTLLLLALGTTIHPVPIADKTIVLSIGIDLGETKAYVISAQILVANTAAESASFATQVISVEADTITEGMSTITERSAKSVSLSHCSIVVVGEDVVKAGKIYNSLSYAWSHSYLSDDANLVVAEGKAYDLLNVNVAFSGSTDNYMMDILGYKTKETSNIAIRTIQDFLIGYHQKGQANYLPIVSIIEAPPKSGSAAESENKKQYFFEMANTMLIRGSDFVGIIDADDSFAINFLNYDVTFGFFNIIGDNGEFITLYVIDKKDSKKYDLESKTVKVKLEFDMILKEINDFENVKSVDRVLLSAQEEQNLCRQLEQQLLDFYKKSQELNVDVFAFEQYFFSLYGNKSAGLEYSDISLEVEVKVDIS